MEKEGLVRSLKFLQDSGLTVDTIITDRHPQIQKYLREMMPSITHYYDVWHTAKGLCNKLCIVIVLFLLQLVYIIYHY